MDAKQGSWSSRLAHRLKFGGSGDGSKNGKLVKPRRNESRGDLTLAQSRVNNVGNHVNELGERHDYQTGILGALNGRHVDPTEVLHSLSAEYVEVDTIPAESWLKSDERDPEIIAQRQRSMARLASLPDPVWHLIGLYLNLADQAALALACKITFAKFAFDTFDALWDPRNQPEKLDLLNRLNAGLPHHLLCFNCGVYHRRIQPGSESLTPDFVNHPVFICPDVLTTVLPRTRLAHHRELPYYFVQLVLRAARFGPDYGISVTALERRWRDSTTGWSHETRYITTRQGHLLLRVRSQVPARHGMTQSEMRMLLFDRDEYTPYFSVCAHWRDGELTRVCKCTLSHVPEPPGSKMDRGRNKAGPTARPMTAGGRMRPGTESSNGSTASHCSFCAPGRRCPECPSEYVAKIVYAEDKYDRVERFKSMLVVTRWCDLGDGSGPLASPEWAAINGALTGYPSLEKLEKRALMGTFESAATGVAPPNRVRNMNPKGEKKGEAGADWY